MLEGFRLSGEIRTLYALTWGRGGHRRGDRGPVVGYVTVEERGEELELVNIDVHRTQQGRGIGSRLVQFVEQRAVGEGRRAVTVTGATKWRLPEISNL